MQVVRHDYNVTQMVPLPVRFEHLFTDRAHTSLSFQPTLTQPTIEAGLHLAVKVFFKLVSFPWRDFFKLGTPRRARAVVLNTSRPEPQFLRVLPLSTNHFGNRIDQAKRHKIRASMLPPMWQIPLVTPDHLMFIKWCEFRRP